MYRFLDRSILGKPLHKKEKYHIIGAGMAGLMLGYHLKKRGVPFQIYEKSHRAGGVIQTTTTPFGIAEGAANGVLWCAPYQNMAEDLGLTLLAPEKANKKRFIVRNDELRQFPFSFGETLGMVKNMVLPKQKKAITVKDFTDTYLSPTATKQLVEPGLLGIYAGKTEELSFAGATPSLAKLQQRSSSLLLAILKSSFTSKSNQPKRPKHLKGVLSFKGGMQTIADALTDYLQKEIQFNYDGLKLKNSQEPLIICTPAHQAMYFFEQHPLQELLQAVPYAPMISTTFFFPKTALKRFQTGFGCLIPLNEPYTIRGVLFNSCIFKHRVTDAEIISLTCIARDFDGSLFQKSDENIIDLFIADLDRLFGVTKSPLHQVLYRWEKGIPLYTPALYESWFIMQQLLEQDFPNIRLFGNYTGQISIRGMCQSSYEL